MDVSDEEIAFFSKVFKKRVLDYLENTQNYPKEGTRTALFDNESFYQTYNFKRKKNAGYRFFSNKGVDHLATAWEVIPILDEDDVDMEINNIKMVKGTRPWNLWEEILLEGTVFYDAVYEGTQPMNYFDRYKGLWNFNRHGRKGIGSQFVTAAQNLAIDAYDYGLDRAEKETSDEFKWEE